MKRKALITGGAGFIGSHLVRRLRAAQWDVVVLDDLSMGKRENLDPDIPLIVGDIRAQADLSRAFALGPFDWVSHQAAKVSVRASQNEYVSDAETNILGTLRVLEACVKYKVPQITFASSMAVYDDQPARTPIDENHPTLPRSPYGLSKLTAEKYLKILSENYSIQVTCLRYFNTYGPGQTFTPYVGVMTIFKNLISKGEPVTVFGDGEQTRDFIHVSDIAEANFKSIDRQGAPFAVFNVGTGVGTSVNEVLAHVQKACGKKTPLQHVPAQAGEPLYSVANSDRLKSDLGVVPKQGLQV